MGVAVDLFEFIPGYEHRIYEAGREPMFVTLVAFIVTFALTRAYTRLARVRGWGSASAGGVHVHHIVVGIFLVLGAGLFIIGFQPEEGFWQLLLCAAFGVGGALILDEFALVFRLEDVYWREEGRSSVDAVAVAAGIGGLVLLHAAPLDGDAAAGWAVVGYAIPVLGLVLVSLLKGKPLTALCGVFIPLVALVGAVRLAKPASPWARRFFRAGSRRRRRAAARYERHQRRWDGRRQRFQDLVGGAPGAYPGH